MLFEPSQLEWDDITETPPAGEDTRFFVRPREDGHLVCDDIPGTPLAGDDKECFVKPQKDFCALTKGILPTVSTDLGMSAKLEQDAVPVLPFKMFRLPYESPFLVIGLSVTSMTEIESCLDDSWMTFVFLSGDEALNSSVLSLVSKFDILLLACFEAERRMKESFWGGLGLFLGDRLNKSEVFTKYHLFPS